jgi:Na+/phosphate symporter
MNEKTKLTNEEMLLEICNKLEKMTALVQKCNEELNKKLEEKKK